MRLLPMSIAVAFVASSVARAAPTPGGWSLDRTETTVAEYARCVAAGRCSAEGVRASAWGPASFCNWGEADRATHPMNCVDWAEADAYCRWAGEHLPTEAEWDFAAGGREHRRFPWGAEAPEKQLCANRRDTGGTCPVGAYPGGASPDGVQDLAGNVWEWTSSRYCPGCTGFATRGGAWSGGWDDAVFERFGAGFRGRDEPTTRGSYLGFRCAKGPPGGVTRPPALPQPGPVPEMPVDLRVLTKSNGTGNELWTEAHGRRVLARAGSLMHGEVRFVLASFTRVVDDELWDGGSQEKVLADAKRFVSPGRLVATVSSPATRDSAGKSTEWSAARDFKPAIVLRSRRNDGSEADVYETAAIFLHELGHTAGFAHDGHVQGAPFPTDGYWDIPAARDEVVRLARWMALHAKGVPPGVAHARFDCRLGGRVPGTNQLFDPPTNAPTEDECAERCLLMPDCVAYARPTWDNARCFLFGRGAHVTTDPGWHNVDTCWRRP